MSESTATIGPRITKRLAPGDLVSPKASPGLTGIVVEVDHDRRTVRFDVNGLHMAGTLDMVVAR